MELTGNSGIGFGSNKVAQQFVPTAPEIQLPEASQTEVAAGGVLVGNGGAIYNEGLSVDRSAAKDIAGIDGAGEVSDKDLDRNDDLGMLFARAFGASMPAMPEFPDS